MWSVLTGSGSFWEGPVPQQLPGSKKSSPSREERNGDQEFQKFEIFRGSDSGQIVVVLTEIVLTEIG
jgi:hypothetical protein